mmetsp:Transcript_39497/g.29173  ORF Transcript_39497/g.29173 Transcript_39497/m.29173 type:complete len:81 (+) Transcript_39497:1778-2020(+)
MAFSANDKFLLSCSRDRDFCVFKRIEGFKFERILKRKAAHARMIFGICWSFGDELIATASREKQKSVKVWHGIKNEAEVG